MNSWATAILWGMLQVTLLTTFGLSLYAVARRRGPAAGALVTVGTLLAVLTITALAIVPLPVDWNAQNIVASLVDWTNNAEAPTTSNEQAGAATTAADKAAAPTPHVAAGAGVGDFWNAFVDEMRRAPVEQSGATRRWPIAVLALFAVGAAFGLFRLIAGATAVRSYRRHSRPISDAALERLTQTLCAENGCREDVEVRESSRLSTPATVGCFSPLVLLPDGWREWSREELRAVLAHEIAHVARGDYLSGLLAQVTLALHFYHPLVHWLVGRMRLEQELAADARGMRASGGRDVYLVTLAGMALRQDDIAVSWAARPFLPTRGTFMRRIEMLRDSRKQVSASLPRGGKALLMSAVALAGFIIAGLRPGVADHAMAQAPAAGTGTATTGLPLVAITPDVNVYMAVKPAAILSKPELAPLAKQLNDVFTKEGVVVDQLEYVAVAFISAEFDHPPQARFTLVNATETDWSALIAGMPYGKSVGDATFGAKKYKVLENDPQRMSIYQVDGRTALIQPEQMLKNYLALGSKTDAPKWGKLWDKVASGHGAIAIDPTFIRTKLERTPVQQLGPMLGFAPLWKDADAAVLGIGLEGGMKIQGYANANSDDGAQRISRTLDAAKSLFLNYEPSLRKQVANENSTPEIAQITITALDAASTVINSAKLTTNGATVELKAEGPADVAVTIGVLAPAMASAREAARRVHSMNNLKQIGLAMFNYESTYQRFPSAQVLGPDGKTVHSWRVAILPFIEQDALYRQYNLNEPWDSENNKKVLAQMPAVYRHPSDDRGGNSSSYFVLTGDKTMFNGTTPTMLKDVTDGLSNTILTVEARREIPWTKPEDIPFDPAAAGPELGGFNPDGYNVGMSDGSVRFLSKLVDLNMLRAMITKAGGDVVEYPAGAGVPARIQPELIQQPTPPVGR